MAHEHDYWEGIRRFIIPPIGKLTQFVNEVFQSDLYVETRARNNQFVGRVAMNEEEFEKLLHHEGYERNPIAGLKKSLRGEVEEGSFRKIDDENPEKQLHLIFYDGRDLQNALTGEIFVYAHYEYRWDVHPIKHYRKKDVEEHRAVMDVREMLNDEGIPYEFIQP